MIFQHREGTVWHELTHVDDLRRFVNQDEYNNWEYEKFIKDPTYSSFYFYTEIRAHYIEHKFILDTEEKKAYVIGKRLLAPDLRYFGEMAQKTLVKMDISSGAGNFEGYLHALAGFIGTWAAVQVHFQLIDETKEWFSLLGNGVYKEIYDYAFRIKDIRADDLKEEISELQRLIDTLCD